jgi:Flp pilus assembly protein TadB
MSVQQSITERGRAAMRILRPRRPEGRADAAGGSDARTGIVAAMVVVLCCLGPLLVAGGVLGALGGLLPAVVIIAVAVALLLVGAIVWSRHLRGTQRDRR